MRNDGIGTWFLPPWLGHGFQEGFENSAPPQQSLGRFLGMKSQNPSVSKSHRLHVVIFLVFLEKFEVHSTGSFEIIGYFTRVLTLSQLFLSINWFICNYIEYDI